jgi:hypothetical protein
MPFAALIACKFLFSLLICISFVVRNMTSNINTLLFFNRCPDKRVAEYFDVISNCGNSGDGGGFGNISLYHRGCCHAQTEYGENYLSPMQIAIEKSIKELDNPRKKIEAKPLSHLHQKYNQARRNETMYRNMEGAPGSYCRECLGRVSNDTLSFLTVTPSQSRNSQLQIAYSAPMMITMKTGKSLKSGKGQGRNLCAYWISSLGLAVGQ